MNPAMGMVLIVGIGLSAVLYYFFASAPEQETHNNRRSRNINLSPSSIHDIHQINSNHTYPSHSSDSSSRQDNVCVICREYINRETEAQVIPCRHTFCISCIQNWNTNGVGNGRESCPICRVRIIRIKYLNER